MKKFLKIAGIVLLVLFVIGLMMPDDEKNTANAETSKATAAADYFAITAGALMKEYDENEVRADEAYKGKLLKVSGRVADIGKDIMDEAYITLETADAIRTIQCMMPDKSVAAQIKKGQPVEVFGKCDGLMMNVLLRDCKVVAHAN